jgi:hypothetical protein
VELNMTMRDPNIPKEEVATRQGTKQRMNMRVLVTSLALIALIFAGFYLMFLAAPHSQNEGQAPAPPQAQQTPTTDQPPTTEAVPQQGTPP